MTQQIIEVEAESVPEARRLIQAKIPPGFESQSEKVISDGQPVTVTVAAETLAAAQAQARSQLPAGAWIVEQKNLTTPATTVLSVKAFDEPGAKTEARRQIDSSAAINTIKLVTAGRAGFLGLGKVPNQYDVEVFQPAVVAITYQSKVKLAVTIDRPWSPPVDDTFLPGEFMSKVSSEADLQPGTAIRVWHPDFRKWIPGWWCEVVSVDGDQVYLKDLQSGETGHRHVHSTVGIAWKHPDGVQRLKESGEEKGAAERQRLSALKAQYEARNLSQASHSELQAILMQE